MQCKNIQNVLPHFAKDELPEADREKLAVHLRSCAACSKVAAEYARLAELTENLPAVTPPVRILDELKQNVRRQISANKETGKQTNRRFAGLLPLFHKPHFAYAWGGALVVLLAVAIWIGSDWHAKPERRTLESYLAHRDYFSLWHALKKPEEQKHLLEDSVSIDLLVRTIDRYDEIKKRYGRFRSASVSFASVVYPSSEGKSRTIASKFLELNQIQPFYLRYARASIQRIGESRDKISLKELLKKLTVSRVLSH